MGFSAPWGKKWLEGQLEWRYNLCRKHFLLDKNWDWTEIWDWKIIQLHNFLTHIIHPKLTNLRRVLYRNRTVITLKSYKCTLGTWFGKRTGEKKHESPSPPLPLDISFYHISRMDRIYMNIVAIQFPRKMIHVKYVTVFWTIVLKC